MNKMNKIFLGGTCNGAKWRDSLVEMLDSSLSYYNPVVDDWTPDCQVEEIKQKESECNIHFYCITSAMTGVFSIAEAIDSVHNKSKRTILHIIPEGFSAGQLKSLVAVVDLVNSRGGIAYVDPDLTRSARVLNACFSKHE